MERIDRDLRKYLIFSLIASIMLPLGIIGIIWGASGQMYILMAVGIAATVFGFYGTPLFWVAYGQRRGYLRLVLAVRRENVLSVADLSRHLYESEEEIRRRIKVCLDNCYLLGYIFDGDTLRLNTNENPAEEMMSVTCPSCGALYTYTVLERAVCPWCGRPHENTK